MKKLIRSSQAALELGVAKNTLLKMAKEGKVPAYLISSGHYRFDIDEVKLALKSGEPDQ